LWKGRILTLDLEEENMDVIIDKGSGLDVHKETVVACVMGSGIKKEIRGW
jgi:hypothetical protein